MTDEQIREVEAKVNAEIVANSATHAEVMPIERPRPPAPPCCSARNTATKCACSKSAAAKEFCGGTHVGRTGDIGFFKIVGEAAWPLGAPRPRPSPVSTRWPTCSRSTSR